MIMHLIVFAHAGPVGLRLALEDTGFHRISDPTVETWSDDMGTVWTAECGYAAYLGDHWDRLESSLKRFVNHLVLSDETVSDANDLDVLCAMDRGALEDLSRLPPIPRRVHAGDVDAFERLIRHTTQVMEEMTGIAWMPTRKDWEPLLDRMDERLGELERRQRWENGLALRLLETLAVTAVAVDIGQYILALDNDATLCALIIPLLVFLGGLMVVFGMFRPES